VPASRLAIRAASGWLSGSSRAPLARLPGRARPAEDVAPQDVAPDRVPVPPER